MKTKTRLYEEYGDSTCDSIYTVDEDGFIGRHVGSIRGEDLKRCAVSVPNCAIGYGATILDQSNYEKFPECRHVIKESCNVYVRLTCNCSETHDALSALGDYPILDEDDYSKKEQEAIQQAYDDFGQRELNDLVALELGVDSTEVGGDIYQIINWQEEVMREESDGGFYFNTKQARSGIHRVDVEKVWACVTKVELSAERFAELDHAALHVLRRTHADIIDSETLECLEVPDFIERQYNPRQVKMPFA